MKKKTVKKDRATKSSRKSVRRKAVMRKVVARKAAVTKFKKPLVRALGSKLLKADVEVFKRMLHERKGDILDSLQQITEDTQKKSQKEASGDISGYTLHMADVATDNYDREFSMGLASNERELLYELNDAMKKIEEGTFGVCEDCKGFIAKGRLKAVPYARLCVKCQEKREAR